MGLNPNIKLMAPPKSILVLSYNICYQAMMNQASGSAAKLGKSCVEGATPNLTICGENIAQFIEGVPTSVPKPKFTNYDFVGLQEASKSTELQKACPNTLTNMTQNESRAVGSRGGKGAHMASYFNSGKYDLVDFLSGEFNNDKKERPFHILLLTEKSTSEEFIFINVHAPHGSDKNRKMNPKKYGENSYKNFDALAFDLSEKICSSTHFNSANSYRIIITGDFNETGWSFKGKKLQKMIWEPLKYAGLNTSVGITNFLFTTSEEHTHQAAGCWQSANGSKGGDYIFSSGTPATISVPTNYQFAKAGDCGNKTVMKKIWQSDHLPVSAIV